MKITLLGLALAMLAGCSDLNEVDGAVAAVSDGCENSCTVDCKDVKGPERRDCTLSCLAGRCGNAGAGNAGDNAGEPGIDCSEDGVCNEFCEMDPDPDCGVPCNTENPGLVLNGSDWVGSASQNDVLLACEAEAESQGCVGTKDHPLLLICKYTLDEIHCDTCIEVGDSGNCVKCAEVLLSAMLQVECKFVVKECTER